jgi:hypothetical protein
MSIMTSWVSVWSSAHTDSHLPLAGGLRSESKGQGAFLSSREGISKSDKQHAVTLLTSLGQKTQVTKRNK